MVAKFVKWGSLTMSRRQSQPPCWVGEKTGITNDYKCVFFPQESERVVSGSGILTEGFMESTYRVSYGLPLYTTPWRTTTFVWLLSPLWRWPHPLCSSVAWVRNPHAILHCQWQGTGRCQVSLEHFSWKGVRASGRSPVWWEDWLTGEGRHSHTSEGSGVRVAKLPAERLAHWV